MKNEKRLRERERKRQDEHYSSSNENGLLQIKNRENEMKEKKNSRQNYQLEKCSQCV